MLTKNGRHKGRNISQGAYRNSEKRKQKTMNNKNKILRLIKERRKYNNVRKSKEIEKYRL